MAEQTTSSRPLVCMRTTRPAPLQAARRRCSAAPSAPPIRPSPPPARIKSPPIAAPQSGRRTAIAALSAAATAPPPHPPPPPSPSPPLPPTPAVSTASDALCNVPSPLIAAPLCRRRGASPGNQPRQPSTTPSQRSPPTPPVPPAEAHSRPHTTTSDSTPPHTHPSAPARHHTWACMNQQAKSDSKE